MKNLYQIIKEKFREKKELNRTTKKFKFEKYMEQDYIDLQNRLRKIEINFPSRQLKKMTYNEKEKYFAEYKKTILENSVRVKKARENFEMLFKAFPYKKNPIKLNLKKDFKENYFEAEMHEDGLYVAAKGSLDGSKKYIESIKGTFIKAGHLEKKDTGNHEDRKSTRLNSSHIP